METETEINVTDDDNFVATISGPAMAMLLYENSKLPEQVNLKYNFLKFSRLFIYLPRFCSHIFQFN